MEMKLVSRLIWLITLDDIIKRINEEGRRRRRRIMIWSRLMKRERESERRKERKEPKIQKKFLV